MFTGLVEETGIVQNISDMTNGKRIVIAANTVLTDLKIGDSIAVNGVCLTVTEIKENRFTVEAVGETLEKTTVGALSPGCMVNLERAMSAGQRFGGHIVQGHVNGIGTIKHLQQRGENWFLEVAVAEELLPYIVPEGSITIDGISLTVAALQHNNVGINVIPHTYQNTNIRQKSVGEPVNIEVDVLAKYVENLLKHHLNKIEQK
jgi:riboflavin synthase